jgi:hypothetical protein
MPRSSEPLVPDYVDEDDDDDEDDGGDQDPVLVS